MLIWQVRNKLRITTSKQLSSGGIINLVGDKVVSLKVLKLIKYLALSKNCGCWLVWIIYCIVGTHGNLILFMKLNEEIDQIFTLDQLNDEFERVVKEWKMMMVKMMARMMIEIIWLILKMMYKIVISGSEYLLQ